MPDAHCGIGIAPRDDESGVARHALLAALECDRKMRSRELEVVLPAVLSLSSLEARRTEAGLRNAVVVAFAGLEPACPERRDPVVTRDRIGVERRDRAIVEARARVELGIESAVEESHR